MSKINNDLKCCLACRTFGRVINASFISDNFHNGDGKDCKYVLLILQ